MKSPLSRKIVISVRIGKEQLKLIKSAAFEEDISLNKFFIRAALKWAKEVQ